MLDLVSQSAISESETESYELEGVDKIKGKKMSKQWYTVSSSELIKKTFCKFFPSSAHYRKDLKNNPVLAMGRDIFH